MPVLNYKDKAVTKITLILIPCYYIPQCIMI